MGTGKRRISTADVVRVAPVVPVVRVALAVPEDPVESVVRVALAVPEDPVVQAVPAVLVVSEDPVVPAVRELELDPVAVRELELGPVAVRELELDPVAVRELELGPVAEVLALARVAVALKTKSVIAAHRLGLVLLLEAGEDLAAVVAETTHEPAAAEAVIAWEVADIVAAAEAAVAAAAE
jgi:hypothetical protein